MKITVLGAGAGGTAVAFDCASHGHDVRLFDFDQFPDNVAKIAVPMFVVQGENDPRVPVTEAEQVVAALREAGQPVWYMNALNEGHGYRKKENRDIYQQATMMFFEKYLIGEN